VVASYHSSGAFNITGVNGYVPFVSFDPSADGVPYAPVLHYTDATSIGYPPQANHTPTNSQGPKGRPWGFLVRRRCSDQPAK
jgi:hypothetical protein